jgi:hypothetical protein
MKTGVHKDLYFSLDKNMEKVLLDGHDVTNPLPPAIAVT